MEGESQRSYEGEVGDGEDEGGVYMVWKGEGEVDDVGAFWVGFFDLDGMLGGLGGSDSEKDYD